jgi:hypothetical protein
MTALPSVSQFFAEAGFPCPPLRNPSDHFLRCVNSDFDKVKATLKGSMKARVRRDSVHQLYQLVFSGESDLIFVHKLCRSKGLMIL